MPSQKLAFIIIASFLMIALFATDVNAEVQFIIFLVCRVKSLPILILKNFHFKNFNLIEFEIIKKY